MSPKACSSHGTIVSWYLESFTQEQGYWNVTTWDEATQDWDGADPACLAEEAGELETDKE